MNLTKLSIQRPILIIVLFLVLGILGLFGYSQLRYELLPNIATPFVTIMTFYPGASPTDVENGLTKPIEAVVSSASKVKHITSQSLENVSFVTIEYQPDTDDNQALQEAQRLVNGVLPTLPADSKAPVLSRYSLADLPVLRLAASSTLPAAEFGRLLSERIRPRLLQVAGVGQITFIGLAETEVQVQLNARRLRTLNLSVLQITEALRASNLNIPSGQVRDVDAVYAVRVVGKTDVLEQLRQTVVVPGRAGQQIQLGDVATIAAAPQPVEKVNRFWSRADPLSVSRNTVGITISKQTNANNVVLSEAIRALLAELEQEYRADGLRFRVAQDASEFTLAAAGGVQHDLVVAIGLVALVMFVFLHSLRSSLIVMVAIPASLLSTFLVMFVLGFTLNLLTLLALSLVIGILVDDSIVVLESIYQFLEKGDDKRTAAVNGRADIGFAALAITLVDVVVFLPLSVLPGLVGDILREFSLVVVVSTLFSLLVSFTLTPMIASRFGQVEHLSANTLSGKFGLWFERVFAWLSASYGRLLAGALHYRKTTIALVGLLFGLALFLPAGGFVGAEFTPPTDKGELSVTLQFAEGQRIEQTDTLARQFEQSLRQLPEVRRIFTSVGSNPEGFGVTPASHSVEFSITFSPANERQKDLATLTRTVKEQAAKLPGVRIQTYPIGILGNDGATPIVLIVSGSDRNRVRAEASRIVTVMQRISGTADVRASGTARKPELDIDTDREKLARYGLTTEQVGTAVRTALAGYDDLKIQQNDISTTVRVRYDNADRNRTDQVGWLSVVNDRDESIELRQVATLRQTAKPAVLERKDRNNAVTISAQAIGRPVGDIGTDIQAAVTSLNIDPSVRVLYGGDLELQDDSFGKLGLAFGAAILFMYLIMVALYNSWLFPFVVLFSIPVAIIGALLALALTQNSLNIFTILGMIMMLGLVAKNAILLVEKTGQNRESGQFVTDALLNAGQTRLRPILMTTLAMVIGMLPIALATGPGAELKSGLAWALVGGLSSSMFLTLVFVPVVYLYAARFSNWVSRQIARFSPGKPQLASVVSGVLMLLSGYGAMAQVPLSLAEAAGRVRQHNGAVRVARFDGQRANTQLNEVRRSWWPTVNGVASYQYNIRPPVFFFPTFEINPATGGFSINETQLMPVNAALKHGYLGAVNLAMPVLQPDLKIARKQAETTRQIATENSRAVVNQQVAEVKKTYLNALLLREQQRLLLASLDRATSLLVEARNRYQQQLATDADTLRAYVDAENLLPGLSKTTRDYDLVIRRLNLLMDYAPDTPLVLTDSLALPPVSTMPTTPETAIDQAMRQRPDLRQLTLNLSQAQLQIEAARVRRLPTLGLMGQLNTQSQLNDFRFANSRWPVSLYVGLQLSVPLFNPINDAKIQQARIGYFQTQEQLRYTKQMITNDVITALNAELEAQERIQNQTRLVQAASRSYALTRDRYRQGVAARADLTGAELALRQSQSNGIQAIYDLLTAHIDRECATGID